MKAIERFEVANTPKTFFLLEKSSNYTYSVINGEEYIFGDLIMADFIKPNYMYLKEDISELETVSNTKILFDVLNIGEELLKGDFEKFEKGFVDIFPQHSGSFHHIIPDKLLTSDTRIKPTINFCKKYGLAFQEVYLKDEKIYKQVCDIKTSVTVSNDLVRCGFSLNSFIDFVLNIYTVYKNWEYYYDGKVDEKNQERFYHIFSHSMDKLQVKLRHYLFVDKFINKSETILVIDDLMELVIFQLQILISNNTKVTKCKNIQCSNYFVPRSNKVYCSEKCKQADYRRRKQIKENLDESSTLRKI